MMTIDLYMMAQKACHCINNLYNALKKNNYCVNITVLMSVVNKFYSKYIIGCVFVIKNNQEKN